MLPVMLDLRGRRVVVLGAGEIGSRKASQLIAEGAEVVLISKEILAELPEGLAEVHHRAYEPGDLRGAFLVVSATGDGSVNDAVVAEADAQGIWANIADDLQRANCYLTANHRDGDVVVAVSSGGSAPALAQWVRAEVAKALPKGLGLVADQLRTERRALQASGGSTEDVDWSERLSELIAELTTPATSD